MRYVEAVSNAVRGISYKEWGMRNTISGMRSEVCGMRYAVRGMRCQGL